MAQTPNFTSEMLKGVKIISQSVKTLVCKIDCVNKSLVIFEEKLKFCLPSYFRKFQSLLPL